jgi:hypothetical protein
MICRREAKVVLHAVAARSQAQRPFCSNMYCVRPERLQQSSETSMWGYGQTNFVVRRARDCSKEIGGERDGFMSGHRQSLLQSRKGACDAVDLRAPRVGYERKPHESATTKLGTTGSISASVGVGTRPLSGSSLHRSIQLINSSRPSKCSTSAVQLSTQSPSLQ